MKNHKNHSSEPVDAGESTANQLRIAAVRGATSALVRWLLEHLVPRGPFDWWP